MTDPNPHLHARTQTARVLEIFLADPIRSYHAQELADLLGWDSRGSYRVVNQILVRSAEAGWMVALDPIRRKPRGRHPRPYMLTPLGTQQATELVAEVHARELVTALIMQLLLMHEGQWFRTVEINEVVQQNSAYLLSRLSILTGSGWVLVDRSRGRKNFRFTLNPAARAEAEAFIAMVSARHS